jgi:hypothetical protein
MPYAKPSYSRNQVNLAGEFWARMPQPNDRKKMFETFDKINNWRACHYYPINTFQMTLRDKLTKIDPDAIVAQRLKRFFSIVQKLRRFKAMKLSTMQDIAGLRAVVHTLQQVRTLTNSYLNADKFTFKHELVTQRDYIEAPKESGYRGVHLVYRYNNRAKRSRHWNGLLIELQIRTRLQHIWATAVETLGTFLDHALKASEGPEEWLNFFSLTGSAFAHLEKGPPVPGYESLSAKETFAATIENADALHVHDRLKAYAVAVQQIVRTGSGDTYHLIVLDPVKKTSQVKSFSRVMFQQATDEYAGVEKRIASGEDLQAVLVSGGPIGELKRAYPNYFLDTHEFIEKLDQLRKRT